MRESVVAKARIAMKLSRSQLAELLGVTVPTLQQWKQGRREPTGAAQMLIKVAIHEPKASRKALAAYFRYLPLPLWLSTGFKIG